MKMYIFCGYLIKTFGDGKRSTYGGLTAAGNFKIQVYAAHAGVASVPPMRSIPNLLRGLQLLPIYESGLPILFRQYRCLFKTRSTGFNHHKSQC
jgi:hypothetical protein